jgi:hypothetical protein
LEDEGADVEGGLHGGLDGLCLISL